MQRLEHVSQPAENYNWLIQNFESYRFNDIVIADKFLPRPYVSLIFHFKDCPTVQKGVSIALDSFFVGPIISRAFTLQFQGNLDTFTITCKASVFSRLFQLDLSPVAKQSIDLPKSIFLPLWKQLSQLESISDRINVFYSFIDIVQTTSYLPDAVDKLYDQILEKSIHYSVKRMIQDSSASKSTLFRKFLKRTGVSPKTMARIVRFNYLWTRINNEQAIDYQDLVFEGNFFDQSHFINDFKAIIGETPHYFFNRNLEVVKLFSGREFRHL